MRGDRFWMGILVGLGAIVLPVSGALAQSAIVPDETLGNERSVVTPLDATLGVPIDAIIGGAQRGQNLFHSFQEFNISAGRGGYFLIPDTIVRNVLARVTGRNRSEIRRCIIEI